MSQLTLFGTSENLALESESKIALEDMGERNTLCEWKTEFADCDREYGQLVYKITVRCREAVITRNIEGKKHSLQGYIVVVLYSINDDEILTEYYKDFLQEERRKAIKEYSWCIVQVFQWNAIAGSRTKTLEQVEDPQDCYECPFCGYMNLEFFETCSGCGERFITISTQ